MASVRVARSQLDMGQLPRVCICCGRPAAGNVKHQFYYQPNWVIWIRFVPMPSLTRRLICNRVNESETITVPVCDKHRHRLALPKYMLYGLLAWLLLGLAAVYTAIALNSSPGEEYVGATIGLFVFLPVVPALIAMTMLQLVTPRVEDFRRDAVHFTAVSKAFAAGIQNPYGQSGPAFAGSPQSRLPAKTSQGKVWTIVGCVLGVTIVLPLLGYAGFRMFVASKMRPMGPRPVANAPFMPNSPPNFHPPMPPPGFPPPPYNHFPGTPQPSGSGSPNANPGTTLPATIPNATAGRTPMHQGGAIPGEQGKPPPPPGSTAITPGSRLAMGTRVWALWGSAWWAATVIEPAANGAKIRYDGHGSEWDEVLTTERLLLVAAAVGPPAIASNPTTPPPASLAPGTPRVPVRRTWSDATGKFQVDAELVTYLNGQVSLKKPDGKVVTIPANKLSEPDQLLLRSLPVAP